MEIMTSEAPLSVREEQRLVELEKIIQDNFLGFVAVGQALAEISADGLYRETHRTFEAYCSNLWDMQKSQAYRLIESSKVMKNLSPIGDTTGIPLLDILPANEAQARELARLEPMEQRQVWDHLVSHTTQTARSGKRRKITALAVKKAVIAFKGEKLEIKITQSIVEAKQDRGDFASEDFLFSFNQFLAQVDIERQVNWKLTSRKTVHKHLATLLDLVAEAGPTTLKDPGCAMELSDREKLKKAGFRIFKMDPNGLLIEEWKKGSSWAVYTSHSSPADLSASFANLLKESKNLKA